MKIKITAIILCVVMLLSFVSIAAEENAARVEISFKVGESVLKINGVDVEVETPFIAGEGTTLVPLRVITEAFGAKVEWIAQTKSIKLEYREVSVTLQIDNVSAQVNDHTETLPVAPMLVNSVTMVPLRFISETFGATVGYNEEDKSITVVKENIETGEIVQGGISEAYVGDSYYGWMLKTPHNYNLVTRTFDGSNTIFVNKSNNAMLYVSVIPNIRGYSLERLQMNADKLFKDGVLSYATFSQDKDGTRYTYSYGTVRGQYQYIVQYVKEGIIYRVIMLADNEGTQKDYLKSVVDSFTLKYNSNMGVYDLSNVSDKNTRIFANELYRTSFEVPSHFLTVTTDNQNEIYLASGKKEDTSAVRLNIYSKSSVNADTYAKSEHEYDKNILNREITGVGAIGDYKIGEIPAKGYDIKIKGSKSYDGTWSKRFFEVEDYVYCLSVRECKKSGNSLIDMIFSSCDFQAINKEDAGILSKPSKESLSTQEYGGTGFVITAPSNWSRLKHEDASVVALEESTTNAEAMFYYQYLTEDGVPMFLIYDAIADFVSKQSQSMNAEIVEELTTGRKNGESYYTATMKVDMNQTPVYVTYVMVYERGYLYRGTLFQYELNAYGSIYEEFLDIVISMK